MTAVGVLGLVAGVRVRARAAEAARLRVTIWVWFPLSDHSCRVASALRAPAPEALQPGARCCTRAKNLGRNQPSLRGV